MDKKMSALGRHTARESPLPTRRECLGLAALPYALPAAENRPLFDGLTLKGWTQHFGGCWSVEDGAITARFDPENPGVGYLFTEQEFEDFHLGLEFWVSRGANSGVFVREPRGTPWSGRWRPAQVQRADSGYEVQINYYKPTRPTGMVYAKQAPVKIVGGEERWNSMEIKCRGRVMRISINGELVNVYRETRPQRGSIGFQMHGGKAHSHVVKFRDIALRG